MDVNMPRRSEMKIPAPVLGLLPALLCLVTGLADRLYVDIDNYLVSVVTNNLFSSLGVNQNTHPLLSMAISALASLYPAADWFAVLTRIGILLAVWWLGVLAVSCPRSRAARLFAYLLLLFMTFHNSLFNENYTVISGLFAATGCVTLLLALRTPMGKHVPWVGAFFLAAGFLWREKSGMLVLPFLLLDLVFLILERRFKGREALAVLLPGVAAVAFVLGFGAVAYRLPAYADIMKYDNARTALNDFSPLPWEEVAAPLTAAGLSENDYRCLTASILIDPDLLNSSLLEYTAAVSKRPFTLPSLTELGGILQEAAGTFGESTPLRFVALAGVGLFLLLLCRRPRLPAVAEAVCTLGGAVLIFFYFACAGRVRGRVIYCLILCVLAVLAPLLYDAPPRGGAIALWLRRAGCAALAAACLYAAATAHYAPYQSALTARRGGEDTTAALTAYSEDALYLWNPMTLDLYMTAHYMDSGKLPPPAFLERNLPYGEWVTGQPYFNEMLARIGTENPMRALAERPNTYLIAMRSDLIQTFLQEHYNRGLTLEQVGTQEVFAMGEVPVWQAVSGTAPAQ